uniref:alanine racemase n=1 Tax=Parerythrobacter lutipelagi TaxID=1964208 RepID=UPI0010FA331E|nr:alanine racemase [Parerythrobacter lutipelagi]
MPDRPPATLRLRVDEAALKANWKTLDRLSGHAQTGAAVKADAYGLGVEHCVPALREAGARHFFVAHWSEVEPVASLAQGCSIAVLHGPMTAGDVSFAEATGAVPVINSLAQAKLWREQGNGPCHLMVDTGINRLGISMQDIGDPLLQMLEIKVLMSHLASADESSGQNALQLDRFRQASANLPHEALSLCNSAGIAMGEGYHFDLTRPGLSLYGGVPRPELSGHIRQVAFPQASVLQLRQISAGDSVGYNATFTADRAMRVAVISLGYADGFLRTRGPEGALGWEDVALPILGKVSMDMIVVDASNALNLGEGDWLDVPFDLPDNAAKSGLSQYELLTTLGNRFDRSVL